VSRATGLLQTLGFVALAAAGVLAWRFELRPELRVDAAPLAALPHRFGVWEGRDVPLENEVESMLRADANIQRAYQHPVGDVVWVYVGYYGTARGGRPEHTPEVCYPSGGWQIAEERTLLTDTRRGLKVNEYVVELRGERRLVHFWYRSSRRTGMLGWIDVSLDHFMGHVREDRADGALVRISTPLGADDVIPARSRLAGFAVTLEEQLADHWPREVPAS
jgi:EpsI family protein